MLEPARLIGTGLAATCLIGAICLLLIGIGTLIYINRNIIKSFICFIANNSGKCLILGIGVITLLWMKIYTNFIFKSFDCLFLCFLFLPLFCFLKIHFFNNISGNNKNIIFTFYFLLSVIISCLFMCAACLGLISEAYIIISSNLAIIFMLSPMYVAELISEWLPKFQNNTLQYLGNQETDKPHHESKLSKNILFADRSEEGLLGNDYNQDWRVRGVVLDHSSIVVNNDNPIPGPSSYSTQPSQP